MNLANRWQNLAYVTLILMGLVAGIILGTDVAHYIGSLQSAQGMDLEIIRLEGRIHDILMAAVRENPGETASLLGVD